MDRVGADFPRTVQMIKDRLRANPVAAQIPLGHEASFSGVIDLIERRAWEFPEESDGDAVEIPVPAEHEQDVARLREDMIEKVAENDEQLMHAYIEGEDITPSDIRAGLRRATLATKVVPVLCGSAVKNKGVQPILDAVVSYLPSPLDVRPVQGMDPRTGQELSREARNDAPFSALAFKVVTDPFVGRLVYLRVYSGTARAGAQVLNSARERKERLGRLLRMHANRREEVEETSAGQIVAAVGLKSTYTGDTVCDPSKAIVLEAIKFPEPVISVAVEPRTKADQDRIGDALSKLGDEDPTFKSSYDQDTGQTILSGMGELHLDIVVDRLVREHKVNAKIGKPQVSYRETITVPVRAEGSLIRQTGGHGQYGHVWLEIEPIDRGAKFEFVDKIRGGVIPRQYVPAVEQGVREALESGVLAGYPMIGIRVTAVDGSYHQVDSSDIAFRLAGAIALRDGVKKAEPVLLEPIMKLEVATPKEFLGDIIGDLNARRARVEAVELRAWTHIIRGYLPLAESFGYATDLRSASQGRATYAMEFHRYQEVPKEKAQEIIARMRGHA
jgi:elongation factor G